jgi:predicted lipoprotein with Yx(FWY)xxD motif
MGKNTVGRGHDSRRSRLLAGVLALGAAATVAACSSSPSSSAASSPSSAAGSSSSASVAASVTISEKTIPGVGTVLVNERGQTLYLLTSEKGGKEITCTQANGCTKVWPETLLTSGMTAAKAGSGVQPSLLGTVKDASGSLEVTYNGWPLYTFSGDSGPDMANGEGITSFGGTWYVLNASGSPVTSSQSTSGSSSSSGGNGY